MFESYRPSKGSITQAALESAATFLIAKLMKKNLLPAENKMKKHERIMWNIWRLGHCVRCLVSC